MRSWLAAIGEVGRSALMALRAPGTKGQVGPV